MSDLSFKCPRCCSIEWVGVDKDRIEKELGFITIYTMCCKDCGYPRIYSGYLWPADPKAPDLRLYAFDKRIQKKWYEANNSNEEI